MKKIETKTCGTCIAFGKSSCVYPASEADCFACSKYQEAYYTLSATSAEKTITQIDSIMEKENKLKHTFISVYKINNERYVVANSIEEAVKLYQDAYEWPYNTVKAVELIKENAWIKSDKDDENITANMQDCESSESYVVQCDYTAKADEKD